MAKHPIIQEKTEDSERRAELQAKARESPTEPGVYQMKDIRGSIIYVGKAKSLKSRLMQYFQPAIHEVPRTEVMVRLVERFDLILTDTEEEALILECTLIKRYKPRYNVRLKDDKAYPFIRVQIGDDYPRLEWTRKVRRDGARYFGPFPSGYDAKVVLKLLTETFKLRDCSDNVFRYRTRPCILHQMDLCTAPCVNKISLEGYRADLNQAIEVLEGNGDDLLKLLTEKMFQASEGEDFEKAALHRDQLRSLNLILMNQRLIDAGSDLARDVMAIEKEGSLASLGIIQIRTGKILGVKQFTFNNMESEISEEELLRDSIAQFYTAQAGSEEVGLGTPSDLLVSKLPLESEMLERTLGVKFQLPDGESDDRLISVARANAKLTLEGLKKKEEGEDLQGLEEVQKKLHLQKFPHKIECYDISNFQGDSSVGSRVVFISGAPFKDLYRRYKIRTILDTQNDFGMLKEVLSRRFARIEDDPLPDLLMVDGGKGQLSQVITILKELGIETLEVAALAKSRTESNFKDSVVESSMERVFLPNRKNPVFLTPGTGAYRVLTQLRDEAHRFAINYHRTLRDKKSLGQETRKK